MAINFEAANMAGYNNPKIGVFKAVVNPNDDTLISAPSKTHILNSLNRGAIPIMLLTYTDPSGSTDVFILRLHYMATVVGEGDTIQFDDATTAITYSPGSEQPTKGTPG